MSQKTEIVCDRCGKDIVNPKECYCSTRVVRIERIFEEIYNTMNSVYASVQHSCVGMHGDNPETMRLLGKLEGIKHLGDEIAELKKKYLPGGDGDGR